MSVQVDFDTQVEQKTGSSGQSVTAATVREALYQVAAAHPSLRLFNCEGELRTVFRIRQGETPAALDSPVRDGDAITLALGK